MANALGIAGGLFALLTFVHFGVDWLFQSHAEAMKKHNHPWTRAHHCAVYTLGFMPAMMLLELSQPEILLGAGILFFSHFVEDTYIPVFLWAKYIRRPPGFASGNTKEQDDKAFMQFIDTTLGKILMITVDQIIHLIFLWPIVYMALN